MRFVWDTESTKYIDKMSDRFKDGIAQGILWSMIFVEEKAKSRFIQGLNAAKKPPIPSPRPPPGPLTSRTGRLRESIKAGAGRDTGWLKTNVPYGHIHEISGINEEGYNIGLRPFLMPAFTENMGKIKETLAEEIVMEMTKK